MRETVHELHAFLASLQAEPGRLEQVEASLDEIATLKRRYDTPSFDELLARAEAARAELAAFEDGHDPVQAAAAALAGAEAQVARLHGELRDARRAAAPAFADAVAHELRGVGLGEGEFRVDVRGGRGRRDRCR